MEIRRLIASDLADTEQLLTSVKLPLEGVQTHFQHFIGAFDGASLIGTAGLEIYGDKGLLRSLAVRADNQGQGRGLQLYEAIVAEARQKKLSEIYLLTETAENFFARQGFIRIPRESADAAVQQSVEFQSVCPASAACMKLVL